MMKHEFEKIAGYEVSNEDYNKIIEPMYMATNLTKEEFVKVIDKKRFALKPLKKMEREMKKLAKGLKESCTHYTDWEAKDQLEELADEYKDRIKAYGWNITDGIKWSCFYPIRIDFYNSNYETFKTISFVN